MTFAISCDAAMSIQSLPDEILVCILSYLDSAPLLRSIFPVCKLWYSCAMENSLWRPLYHSRWGGVTLPRSSNTTNNGMGEGHAHNDDQLSPPLCRDACDRDGGDDDVIALSWFDRCRIRAAPAFLRFLVLASEQENARVEEVRTNVQKLGLVHVDVFNVREAVPTYDMIASYDAVLFFTYFQCKQDTLGDLLSRYVDAGGGVVVAAYSTCVRGNRLLGRWEQGGYDVQAEGSNTRVKGLTMGTVSCPSHPVMKGVRRLHGGGQSNHGNGAMLPHATLIAQWENGMPLVMESRKFNGSILGLNFYPPSSASVSGSWQSETDGGRLLRNALYYVTGAHGRPNITTNEQ
eukprot:TRINITY_DN4015_c0_g1_i1.p1 TRINITY_DN4015_c0_g1~~TRINITY_DN4015_c0_g1_i1.p1  ORF type:complete len:384 (+),score=47.32 TRINITY_DN4015_c0_g1_i1:114-1154(+)